MELTIWIGLISSLTALVAVFMSPLLTYIFSKRQFWNQNLLQERISELNSIRDEIVKFMTAGSLYLEWKIKYNSRICSLEEYTENTKLLFEKMLDTRHKISFTIDITKKTERSIYDKIQKCIDLLVLQNDSDFQNKLLIISNDLAKEVFLFLNEGKEKLLIEY